MILGFVWACSSTESESVHSSEASAAVPNGQQLYKSYCVTCHGINGDMKGSGAFDLTVSTLTLDERIHVITNGRNAMASFKSLLSPEKIRAVAEYTLQLTPTK